MYCKSFYLSVSNEERQAAGKLTRITDDSFSECRELASEIIKCVHTHAYARVHADLVPV